jgi:hypothetical protein
MSRYFSGLLLASLAACSDSPGPDRAPDLCQVTELPVTGSPNAPTVTDVALEAQPTDGIVVLATATDPQGDANLQNVIQTIRLFPDAQCRGTPIVVQDDLVGSGIEESFGIAVPRNQPLFDAIEAAEDWPVEVEFEDSDGNTTSARVAARVIPLDLGGASVLNAPVHPNHSSSRKLRNVIE